MLLLPVGLQLRSRGSSGDLWNWWAASEQCMNGIAEQSVALHWGRRAS